MTRRWRAELWIEGAEVSCGQGCRSEHRYKVGCGQVAPKVSCRKRLQRCAVGLGCRQLYCCDHVLIMYMLVGLKTRVAQTWSYH